MHHIEHSKLLPETLSRNKHPSNITLYLWHHRSLESRLVRYRNRLQRKSRWLTKKTISSIIYSIDTAYCILFCITFWQVFDQQCVICVGITDIETKVFTAQIRFGKQCYHAIQKARVSFLWDLSTFNMHGGVSKFLLWCPLFIFVRLHGKSKKICQMTTL